MNTEKAHNLKEKSLEVIRMYRGLTRARKTVPSFDQAFSKLVAAIEGFDVAKVRYEDVRRAAVFAAPAGD